MDSQKDVQPPKQQPMIYICGGISILCQELPIVYQQDCHSQCDTIVLVCDLLCTVFQSATPKMRSRRETPSDAENAVTESCIRKEPKDVSFLKCVNACNG